MDDLLKFAAWIVDNLPHHGCLTGDCPHWDKENCAKDLVELFREDQRESDAE